LKLKHIGHGFSPVRVDDDPQETACVYCRYVLRPAQLQATVAARRRDTVRYKDLASPARKDDEMAGPARLIVSYYGGGVASYTPIHFFLKPDTSRIPAPDQIGAVADHAHVGGAKIHQGLQRT
jgi:hypothetical protein